MIHLLAREKKMQKMKDDWKKEKINRRERDPVLQRHHERLDMAIQQQLTGRQPRQITKVGRPRKFIIDSGKFAG